MAETSSQGRILWADDEIDLLKPHILFLEKKGYQVLGVNNGLEAVERSAVEHFDVVFLDEQMPGLTGLEALSQIKAAKPALPVVMITKSEEENIMEEAIGAKIADYLIKPLNPNQILLSLKKLMQQSTLVDAHTTTHYQREFQKISQELAMASTHQEWAEVYQSLVYWELEISATEGKGMAEVLAMQKQQANSSFASYVVDTYCDWVTNADADRPLLSHQVLSQRVLPLLGKGKPVFLVVVDNMRLDQWRTMVGSLTDYFTLQSQESYYSLLPTTTAYCRNALFAGLLPQDIARLYPQWWVGEDEGSKNNHEADLLEAWLQRSKVSGKHTYTKVLNAHQGKNWVTQINGQLDNVLNAVVFNFVDMLSHARTDMAMIKELAPNEMAYRSLTQSWLQHSTLMEGLKLLSEKGATVVVTTDHGTVRVKNPVRIVGDREVNTNFRYKQGRNLNLQDAKAKVLTATPEELGLPKRHLSTRYAIATDTDYFVYPNNFNEYARRYADTFQHGGISLEEMIVPFAILQPKN